MIETIETARARAARLTAQMQSAAELQPSMIEARRREALDAALAALAGKEAPGEAQHGDGDHEAAQTVLQAANSGVCRDAAALDSAPFDAGAAFSQSLRDEATARKRR